MGEGYFTMVGKQELYATETGLDCKYYKYKYCNVSIVGIDSANSAIY